MSTPLKDAVARCRQWLVEDQYLSRTDAERMILPLAVWEETAGWPLDDCYLVVSGHNNWHRSHTRTGSEKLAEYLGAIHPKKGGSKFCFVVPPELLPDRVFQEDWVECKYCDAGKVDPEKVVDGCKPMCERCLDIRMGGQA